MALTRLNTNAYGATVDLASNVTGTLANSNLAAGNVVQVVQTIKSDTFSSNEQTNFIDITGVSVSITPTSSTNKILVMYRLSTSVESGAYAGHIRLLRDSTDIAQGDASGSIARVTTSAQSSTSAGGYPYYYQCMDFLDSPATTSATTYKLQGRGWNGSAGYFYVNRSASESDTVNFGRGVSSIIAMEIIHDS